MENNNEPREITQDELDKIVGGYAHDQARMQQQRPAGIPCPCCNNLIPISVQQILLSHTLFCPFCGLRLSIDKQKSDRAQKVLAKIDEETRHLIK